MTNPQLRGIPPECHRFEIKNCRLLISMWDAGGFRYWVSFDLANGSDDRIGVEDLEDIRLIRSVDVAAAPQA